MSGPRGGPSIRRLLDAALRRGNRAGHLALGRRGERLAARLARRAGHGILARNVMLGSGELDLVTLGPDGSTIVVIEVKTRAVGTPGSDGVIPPEANITEDKRRRLRRLTEQLRRREGWLDRPVRIDVIAVEIPQRGKPRARWFENAV